MKVILLDTSALIDSFTGSRHLFATLERVLLTDERVRLSCLVIYEWLRGPRTLTEIAHQEKLFPASFALPYDHEDARIGADIYRRVARPRSREIDIAIAATAIRHQAQLWTLNPADFADIPGLRLYRP